MSRMLLSKAVQDTAACTGSAAKKAANRMIDTIVAQLCETGHFAIPGFGSFMVRTTKARRRVNPRTGAPIMSKEGRTVRFKASPLLRQKV